MTGDVLSADATKVDEATTSAAGTVTLADAAAITAGTVGRIPDAAQLKGQIDARAAKANPEFTGVVTLPAGTAANPSLTFTGDVDTGLFQAAANTIGLVAGGTSALEASPTGVKVAGTLTAGGLTYPAVKGTSGQVLSSNGAGKVEWVDAATGGTTYTLPQATPLAIGGVKVADAAAITLGAAGYVVDAAQMKTADEAFVQKAGDKMTGALSIHSSALAADGLLSVVADGNPAVIAPVAYSNNATGSPNVRFRRARGTLAAPAILQVGDAVGFMTYQSVDTTGAWKTAAQIRVDCIQQVAAGNTFIPASMTFFVANATGNISVMVLTAAGATFKTVTADTLTATGPDGVKTGNLTATGVVQTVALNVDSAATFKGRVIHNATEVVGYNLSLTSLSATAATTGIVVNVMPVVSATSCGVRISNQGKGTGTNIGMEIEGLPAGPNNYSFFDNSPAQNYFKGNVGINFLAPTANLEVSGTTKLRGTLEVTGNITSAGTAHSFAAKSIPASAIDGGLSIPNKTPASQTAPGAAGEFAWDSNYLYGCIAANQWRRLPWLDWGGAGAAGAGVTDPSLPVMSGASFGPSLTQTGFPGGEGRILMTLGGQPLAPVVVTGIKVQYRTVGGSWVDANVHGYYDGNTLVGGIMHGTVTSALILGPVKGTPYITRMAWVSSTGIGPWSIEYPAVTPTAS
jgi:hypothetical protein